MTPVRKRYRAFISYSQKDTKVAQRLHRALENYRVPLGVSPDVIPSKRRLLGKFFRDTDDMSAASDISATVRGAIEDSESLIVICSPRSAQSRWVDTEIQHFRRTGRGDRIFAVIIDGDPNSGEPNTECFPPSLRLDAGPDLHSDDMPVEPVGIDLRIDSLERVCARIAAGLLGVPFDQLWQRRRREAIRQWLIRVGVAFAAIALTVGAMVSLQSNAARAAGQTISNAFADQARDASAAHRYDRAARYALAGLNGANDPLVQFDAGPAQAELLRADAGGRAVARLQGHKGGVLGVVFSPDGTQVLSFADDETARLWNWRSGAVLRVLEGHDGPITGARFSANGRHVVTSGTDKTARIWDATTGVAVAILGEHDGEVLSLALSADGARIATGDTSGIVNLWDAQGKRIARLANASREIPRLAFSPDHRRLQVVFGQTVQIWSSAEGRLLRTMRIAGEELTAGAWSADSSRVAVASASGRTHVLNASSGRTLRSFVDNGGAHFDVLFAPDGGRVFSLADDGAVVVWSVETGAYQSNAQTSEGLMAAALSPDGRILATAGGRGEVALWSGDLFEDAGKLVGHENGVNGLAFSPDGAWLATASDDGAVRIWRLAAPAFLTEAHPHKGAIGQIAMSPDGAHAALASNDHTVSIIDLTSLALRHRSEGHTGPVKIATFNPAGTQVATSGEAGELRLWDAASGAELFRVSAHRRYVHKAAFSPDGGRILTLGGDGAVRLWGATSGRPLLEIPVGDAFVADAAFSPDGARIATAGGNGVARIWDANSGAALAAMSGPKSVIDRVLFSPNGARLLTVHNGPDAALWDAATGAQIAVLSGHQREIRTVAFSADSAWIVTGSNDNDARLWDGMSGRMVRALRGHLLPIADVAFSPNGAFVATASDGGSARLWDVPTGREVAQFRGPGFTPVTRVAFTPDSQRVLLGLEDGRVQMWDVRAMQRPAREVRAAVCAALRAGGVSTLSDAELERARAIDPRVSRDVCRPNSPWARLLARPQSVRPAP